MSLDSRPLYSVEAEMAMLGAMLMHERAATQVLAMVRESDVYRPAHRTVLRAMRSLRQRGLEIDQATLETELGSIGELANVGGPDYLLEVSCYVPSANNALSYAETVLEHSRLRSLEAIGRTLVGKVHDCEGGAAVDLSSWAVGELSGIGGTETGFCSLDDIDERGGDGGHPTGIGQIDRAVSTKGVPSGQMTVVVAREKHGKSALKIQMALSHAAQGLGVGYLSLADLNPKRLKRRMLRALCGFSERSSADFHGFGAEFDQAKTQLERDFDLTIIDRTKAGTADVDQILASIESLRQRKERTSTPLAVVYADYGQKFRSSKFKASDRVAMYDYVSSEISAYAERSGLALVVGSQLTDGNEKEGRDPITKGSRAWLEDCGLALWVQRSEGDSAILEVLRSRFGGMGTKVPMIYRTSNLRFEEVGR